MKQIDWKKVLKRGLAVVLAVLLFWSWQTMGWVPVVGNVVSTAVLSGYARRTYPDAERMSICSFYDLISGEYYYDVHLKDPDGYPDILDDQDISLKYDLKQGRIFDSRVTQEQSERLLPVLEKLNETMRTKFFDGIILSYYLSVKDQQTVQAHLRVDTVNTDRERIPTEEEMRAEMARRCLEAYEVLSPLCNITDFSAHYTSAAVNKNYGHMMWWGMRWIKIPKGQPLSEKMILDAPLTFN